MMAAMASGPHPVEWSRAGLRFVGDRRDPAGASRGLLVLLHGGGQTRHSWSRTSERMAEAGWSVVTIDARGHGDSDWDPAGDYSLDAYVEDVLAELAELEAKPVLIGASLGGISSLVVAGEHPQIARALVLVDVVIDLDPEGARRINSFLTANPEGFESLDEVADAIAAYNPLRPRPKNLDGLRKNVRLGEDGRWHWHWDPAFIQIDDEPQRKADPERLRAAAANISIPTLLVRGAESDLLTDRGVEDLKRRIPAAEVVVIPRAGHMVAGDDNDVFVGGLGAFLDRVEAG